MSSQESAAPKPDPAINEATNDPTQKDALDNEEGDEEGDEEAGEGETGVASLSKKKKPRKKKKKAADSTEPSSTSLAQPPRQMNVSSIQDLMKQLDMSNAGKKEGKAPEDYKFWNTQPVPKFKEPNLLQTTDSANGEEALPEGAILPAKICKASAKAEPEKLIDGFEWCLVDVEDKAELQELYELLDNHYVEDTDGSFRFKYSPSFLAWALKPPGWKKEWHIGVRTKMSAEGKKGKLIAFIAGIPVTLKVGDSTLKSTEINFLTIHRKLRGKRLAPVLIKEVTRQCYLNDIFQALYTAGTLLPTPVSTCRYYHRSLDWEHLYKTGFSHLPPHSTELRQKYKYKVESHTSIKGLRPMKKGDIPEVKDLLVRYLERFQMRQDWTVEEIEHWLCSEASKDVVWSFVVEKEGGGISDFASYYLLESTVLRSNKQETIRAAYLFYYASDAAFPPATGPKPKAKQIQDNLAARLQTLMHDVLILAKKDDFHVFNALTLLDNPLFLKEQKFEPGDGRLHYYLFNWRTKAMPGGINESFQMDASKMGGVGVVML